MYALTKVGTFLQNPKAGLESSGRDFKTQVDEDFDHKLRKVFALAPILRFMYGNACYACTQSERIRLFWTCHA